MARYACGGVTRPARLNDAQDVRACVGEPHRRDRARRAVGKIDDSDTLEYT